MHDLERNGYKVVAEEVTMKVNGSRVRAEFVAKICRVICMSLRLSMALAG